MLVGFCGLVGLVIVWFSVMLRLREVLCLCSFCMVVLWVSSR